MTAAHCVVDDGGNLVDNLAHVFLGHADLYDPCGVEVKIESAVAHPDYSSVLPVNDIALLKLVRPGRQFNRSNFCLSFGLKNGLRFYFHTEMCLNYPFLNIFL